MQGVIHYNPRLQHQVDHARAFQACGFGASSSPDDVADVHVVSGPWFAYEKWRNHPRTLMIDRAWWGDPDCVSIGWLQPDGTRKYATGTAERPKPDLYDWKRTLWEPLSCLILADYRQNIEDIHAEAKKRFVQVEVRRHPSELVRGKLDGIPLNLQCTWYDAVICTSGTAAFEPIIRGIPTICLDPKSELAPVCSDAIDAPLYRGDRHDWLHDMSYKQWSLAEIASGEAWEHLKDIQ